MNKYNQCFCFCFCIAEAVILSTNYINGEESPYVWGCILYTCITHFITFLFSPCISIEDENHGTQKITGSLISLGLIANIWNMYCFYSITGNKLDMYKSDHPNLWNMLLAEVIIIYIGLAIIFIGIAYFCLGSIYIYVIEMIKKSNTNKLEAIKEPMPV